MKRFLWLWAMTVILFCVGLPLPADSKSIRIGMVLKTLHSAYWQGLASGARMAAGQLQVNLVILGPESEDAVEKQLQMAQSLLDQGIDILIFSPSQPAAAVPLLTEARRRQVQVILVDTGMPPSFTDYASLIGTDNLEVGRIGGRALADVLKKGDRVILLDGAPGNPTMNDRIRGAEEELRKAGILIVSKQPAYSDRTKAFVATQNLLQANPDIRGVFAANDDQALGALRAFQQAGKWVPVIGVDAVNEALRSILAGELYGTVAQENFKMGWLSVEKALSLLEGKSIERRIEPQAYLITGKNASELLSP